MAGRPPIEETIYKSYQKNMDKVIEHAFENIAWYGSPPDYLQQASGNSIAFPIGNTFVLLATIGIVEGAHNDFAWKVITSLIVSKTKKIHKQSMWTRRQRQSLINVAKAFFQGCGKRTRMSYEINSSVLVAFNAPSDEDLEVIKVVRQERDKAFEEEVKKHFPEAEEKPKRKPRKKKEITAQTEL